MKFGVVFFGLLLIAFSVMAQEHPGLVHKMDTGHAHKKGHLLDTTQRMTHAFSRNLPMNRNGSGTSWLPDNSPMYMLMWEAGNWDLMLHYNIFGVYTWQNFNHSSKRGADMFFVPNWTMLMANKNIGEKGKLLLRVMISADPLTVGGFGYPLLYQTGETWQGSPLVDRQHPHDLIGELAVGYSHAFSTQADIYAYFGMPGEPALGPPTYIHRPSALNNYESPIGHHWQDATHITFGVATIGYRYRNVKAEGSIFTGKEPDENRYGFDKPRFNSYSFRFSWNPFNSLALQASAGYLKDPENEEVVEPHDKVRITASAVHNLRTEGGSVLSSSAVWGMNIDLPEHGNGREDFTNSFLLESGWQAKRYNVFFRGELVEKSSHDLELNNGNGHQEFNILACELGASVYVLKTKWVWIDLGAMGKINNAPKKLQRLYGQVPVSASVFLRLIAPRM